MHVVYEKLNIFTIRNSVNVNSSGSYVCADQEPHFFFLRAKEDLQKLRERFQFGKWSLISQRPFTLNRSKLVFLSIGFRSPWRQTQESWWFLLSGPRN